ncbi:MAG: hypothetical protein ACTSYB_05100 [Candidatus Helarchaeota archaeon]
MVDPKFRVYSISGLRISIGFLFLLVGLLNILFIDSNHQAGVLFPLPYFVTTGLPPALFGLGILLHTLLTSFKFTITRKNSIIHIETKFIFRKTREIPLEEIHSVKLGDTRNRYKYVLFGIWFIYVIFTLKSGMHQLNVTYGAIMIVSGVTVLLLNCLLIIYTRKEITLETEQGRIWANVTKLDLKKLQEIFQMPSIQTKNAIFYQIADYTLLGIGGLFIGLAFLIYFILPFSTFVDIFLLIYGVKICLSTFQNAWGTLTFVKEKDDILIHTKGPLRETIYFAKNHLEFEITKRFKPIHPIELGIIGFLGFQTTYATIRAIILADIWFIFQALALTSIIIGSILVILFRLKNYLSASPNIQFPLSSTQKTPLFKVPQPSNFFEDIVKFSQVKMLYFRVSFIFFMIFVPLLAFTLAYPILL